MAIIVALILELIIDLVLTVYDYNHNNHNDNIIENQKYKADIVNAIIRLLCSVCYSFFCEIFPKKTFLTLNSFDNR